jgi:hypothetical protein
MGKPETMTSSSVTTSNFNKMTVSTGELTEYWVTIRSWGPNTEPGKAKWAQYVVHAKDSDSAEDKAGEKAKNHPTRSIVDHHDSWEIVEMGETA